MQVIGPGLEVPLPDIRTHCEAIHVEAIVAEVRLQPEPYLLLAGSSLGFLRADTAEIRRSVLARGLTDLLNATGRRAWVSQD